MAFWRFVLEPAAEIASELLHPELGWTVGQALEHLNTALAYVAVAGLPGAGKSKLAAAVAKRTGARLISDPVAPPDFCGNTVDDLRDRRFHLRYLARRREMLDPANWQPEPSESISDFWFEQTSAHAHGWLSTDEMQEYDQRHEEARGRIVPAKLLIFLEVESAVSAGSMSPTMSGETLASTVSRLETIRGQLDKLAAVPRRQPTLRLPAADFDRAVEETVAAVETMR